MRRAANNLAWLSGGALNHLATISQPATPTDGETKPTWSNLDTSVPVQRLYRGGFQSVGSDQSAEYATELVRMHYRSDVTPQMRIRINTTGTDDVLEIVSLGDPVGNRMWLECRCNRLEST